jgi:hypothetical protein
MDSLLKNAACVIPQPKTKQLLPLFWLTESRLLVQERRPTGSPPQVRTGILDIPSGKTTYPASVPRYLKGSLSPNKKWVLCEPPTQWDYEGVLWVEAVSLNGQPTRRWTYAKPELGFQVFKTSNFFWLPDGRSWVLLAYASTNKGNLIYALTGNWTEKPYIKVFPLGLSQDDISPSTNTQSAHLQRGAPLAHLIDSPDGDLIRGIRMAHNWEAKTVTFHRWEFRRSQGERSQREFPITVPFPKGEIVCEIVSSPTSQRLAVLTASYHTPNQFFLHTLQKDGPQRACLGTLTLYDPKGTQLQWLSSGKKLSFRYDNALWVVPDAPPKQP